MSQDIVRIPDWPKRGRGGARPIREMIFEAENETPGNSLNAARVRVRSELYRNGEPMVCLSCGSLTDIEGYLPCDH